MVPKGLRNLNPGNLEYNKYTAAYVGCTGSDGRFCTFDTMEHGLRALALLLLTYQRLHGIKTVRDAINRWAPPSENDTGAYVNAVTAEVAAVCPGVGPDTPLDFSDPTVLRALTVAIGRHENGRDAFDHYCSADQIDAGVGMALGIRPQDVVVVGPVTPEPTPTSPEEKPVAPLAIPIISAILQSLTGVLPTLGAAFGKSGEKVAAQATAAVAAATAITQAVGAVNLQDAAEKVQTDPAARAAASAALLAEPAVAALIEVGGGIGAARKAAADPNALPFWRQGLTYVTVLFMLMPMMLVVDFLFVHPDKYIGDLRTQIVTAILLIITVVGAVWFGTTVQSQRKTELIATRSE